MSDSTTTVTKRRELAHRASDGVEVTLFWYASDDSLLVTVVDWKTDEVLEIPVRHDQAMNAFHHPYVYAALDRMHSSAALARAAA